LRDDARIDGLRAVVGDDERDVGVAVLTELDMALHVMDSDSRRKEGQE